MTKQLRSAEEIVKGCRSRAKNQVMGLSEFGSSLSDDLLKFIIREMELEIRKLVEELNSKNTGASDE